MNFILRSTIWFLLMLASITSNAQTGFFKDKTLALKVSDCAKDSASICLTGIVPTKASAYALTLNGVAYSGPFKACAVDATVSYNYGGLVTVGPYIIDSVRLNGKLFLDRKVASISNLVDSLNKWDAPTVWALDASNKTLTGSNPGAGKYNTMRIVPESVINSVSNIGANFSFSPTSSLIKLPAGAYILRGVEPVTNIVDSMKITVACKLPSTSITKTVNVGQTATYCIPQNATGTREIIEVDYLTVGTQDPVEYKVVQDDKCITYKGLIAGTSKIAIIACDASNSCDTTFVTVESKKVTFGSRAVYDVVNQGQTAKYCVDTTGFGGIASVTNALPLKSGKNVKFTFTPNDPCISIEGLTFGVDTASIVIKSVSGQSDTTILYYTTVKSCKVFQTDSLFSQTNKCSLKGEFCIPKFSLTDALTYQFNLDGIPYTGTKKGCDFDTIRSYSYTTLFGGGTVGPYEVTSWFFNNQVYNFTFNTLPELVDSMNLIDTKGKWKLLTNVKQIVGGFPGNSYSDIKVLQTQFSSPSVLGFNIGLKSQGTKITFETGAHKLVVTNPTTGCADTLYAFYQCVTPEIITENIKVGQTDTTCIKVDQLFGNKAVSIINTIPNTAGSAATFTFSADKKCLIYTGVKVGTDTAIIIACDAKKICDTTIVYVNVGTIIPVPNTPKIYRDTLIVGLGAELCIDTAFAQGQAIKSFQNICTTNSGNNVTFKLNPVTYCIEYNATTVVGVDTACIVTCTATKCDTTIMYIVVTKLLVPTKGILKDTVIVSATGKRCIKASDLKIAVGKDLVVTNLYINGVKNADITADLDKSCFTNGGIGVAINYTGLKPGNDTACIEIKDVATGKLDTVKFYLNVVPRKIIAPILDTVTVTETKFICIDLKKLNIGAIDTIFNDCPKSSGTNVTVTLNKNLPACQGLGITFQGLVPGTDTACIILVDVNGLRDTITAYLTAVPKKRKPNVYTDNIAETTSGYRCFDVKDFDLGADVDSIYNACPNAAVPNATFEILPIGSTVPCKSGLAIKFTGVKVGIDTACIVFIDKNGDRDTATVYVTVIPVKPQPKNVFDTIYVNQIKSYCIDSALLNLKGKITGVQNICPNLSGTDVSFLIDTLVYCSTINGSSGIRVTYNGLKVGVDTACIAITDSFGKSDTIRITVFVKVPTPSIVNQTISVGEIKTYCVDTTQLSGPVTSIVNICPNKSGTNVKFEVDNTTKCVKMTGLLPGVDTACIVICDAKGVCDTTTIYTNVTLKGIITAIDDNDSTSINVAVSINVLKNDILGNTTNQIVTVKILPKSNGGIGAKHGTPIVDTKNNTIMYVPEFGFSGRDTFTYVVCVGTVCDTANVYIYISPVAKDFKIFNGLSPNGDGKNEVFFVQGIESYPGTEVSIFNRWGNRVYLSEDYKNDWAGTYNTTNGDLPDGTYYYVICRFEGKDVARKIFSGWLQIAR